MQSLRAVGCTTSAAVADLVDNSIAAKARKVAIRFTAPPEPFVAVCRGQTAADRLSHEARTVRVFVPRRVGGSHSLSSGGRPGRGDPVPAGAERPGSVPVEIRKQTRALRALATARPEGGWLGRPRRRRERRAHALAPSDSGAWDSRSVELGLVRYANSAALLSSRARALTTLRQINSQMNPFRFIVYSEWSGKALAPVSPQ
jgi:hypothetical protein